MSDLAAAPRILIADDDPQIREILSEVLTDNGASVTAAADGKEAVHQALLAPYDLFILDFEMPNMTGVEACRALRQNAFTAKTPILFMTGRIDEASITLHAKSRRNETYSAAIVY